MEDMARLALVEQSVRDIDKFSKLLHELLYHINHILENPHDYQQRTIKSNILKDYFKLEPVAEYLKYVGFEPKEDTFVYSDRQTLSNLRMAQVAIERKISLCCDGVVTKVKSEPSQVKMADKNKLLPVHVLSTRNPLLLKIQDLFNNMLVYEDPELQALAREHIPLVTLQVMALDRVREHQAKIKKGETKEQDLPFDIALLMELILWFKHKFFKWVDCPPCEECGAATVARGITTLTDDTETCRVELYKCPDCDGQTSFPRYNDVRKLVASRRGRCGEWANCFTLLCRALGYDARYVYDVTDHVWCEVFDYDSNAWLHVDPCEGKLNAPLLYSHGWGKQLSYVIAVSRDDVQDVTWRYTMSHKQVLTRRTECTEMELIECLLKLREARQRTVSDARRTYLAKRTLQELVNLMVEKKPSEYESGGRISGSSKWRMERGELGVQTSSHTFTLPDPAQYEVRYHPSTDKYTVIRDGEQIEEIRGWSAGVYHASNMFRKVEHDWKKVYLAREEGAPQGSISWRVCAGAGGGAGSVVGVRLSAAVYEAATIAWTLALDDQPPQPLTLSELEHRITTRFRVVTLSASLAGGTGDVAWQHAQLFRRNTDDKSPALVISVTVEPEL